jgi:hypothetical protein
MRKYLKYLFAYSLLLSPIAMAEDDQGVYTPEIIPHFAARNGSDPYMVKDSNKESGKLSKLIDEIYQRLDLLAAEVEKLQTCKEICLNQEKGSIGVQV